jgi:hypothetical protein
MPAMAIADEAAVSMRVEDELAKITDPRVLVALKKYLVRPRPCLLGWDYGHPHAEFPEPRYPGFVILEHRESDTGIAYSEYGSALYAAPWVLTGLSDPGYGMDSSWFKNLEAAFRDSMAYDEPELPGHVVK